MVAHDVYTVLSMSLISFLTLTLIITLYLTLVHSATTLMQAVLKDMDARMRKRVRLLQTQHTAENGG